MIAELSRAAALAGVAIAQRVAGACGRAAGVDSYQSVQWVGGPWCAIDEDPTRYAMLYYLEPARWGGGVAFPERVTIVRLGAVVAAVEWAPDGGGTTRVFLARDELTGAGAAEMQRWREAQDRRDDDLAWAQGVSR